MKKATLVTCLTLLACLLPMARSPARDDKDAPRYDLKALAGEYYRGDGLGANYTLVMTERGGFTYTWFSDDGQGFEVEGTAEVVDGRLVLRPKNPESRGRAPGKPPGLIPVAWGRRLYLLSDEDFPVFCNAVNLGIEPRTDAHGRTLIRVSEKPDQRGNELGAVEGLPKLPALWGKRLLARPIEGKITSVEADGVVEIDLGTEDGIWVGMDLWVDVRRRANLITVTEAKAKSCRARMKDPDVTPERPRKGQYVFSWMPLGAKE